VNLTCNQFGNFQLTTGKKKVPCVGKMERGGIIKERTKGLGRPGLSSWGIVSTDVLGLRVEIRGAQEGRRGRQASKVPTGTLQVLCTSLCTSFGQY
jgi:hypothetical protein